MKCNVCQTEMLLLDDIKEHEVDVTSVYHQPYLRKTANMAFYRCPQCGHGQIAKTCYDDYYENYRLINNGQESGLVGAYTPTLLAYYDRQFKRLAEFCCRHDMVMDIGCGSGVLLARLLEHTHSNEYYKHTKICGGGYFKHGVGIEPSTVQAHYAAEHSGARIVNAFFDTDVAVADDMADGFIATQVFEHIDKLRAIARTALAKLKIGGVGFVEVPNGEKIINENRYQDIFPEHINYFTPQSLATLLGGAGYEILCLEKSFHENFLVAYVRKPRVEGSSFSKTMQEKGDKLRSLVARYPHYAIWGCGTKAHTFVPMLRAYEPQYIFDVNVALQGCYLPGSGVQIEQPSAAKINACDMVLVLAAMYKDEIVASLRAEFGFAGEIYCIDDI